MDFKIGYNVKPKEINLANKVIFEKYNREGSGFEDVVPTQEECEAYGFDFYDGKCSIVSDNTEFIKIDNTIQAGKRNDYKSNTDDCLFSGIDNTIFADCNNDLVVGNNNSIINEVDNTIISGTKGEATASNSIVLAGNNPTDNLAERQATTLMYGVQTTANGTVASYLNNTTNSLFAIPTDTAMYFHADILAVRVGGTATGNPGDFLSWVERGVVINKSGVLSIQRERDTIKGYGNHTNWRPTAAVSGTNFVMNVRGAADMTIEWASTIRFTEIRTGVAL